MLIRNIVLVVDRFTITNFITFMVFRFPSVTDRESIKLFKYKIIHIGIQQSYEGNVPGKAIQFSQTYF